MYWKESLQCGAMIDKYIYIYHFDTNIIYVTIHQKDFCDDSMYISFKAPFVLHRDICSLCTKAKDELSANLHARLR